MPWVSEAEASQITGQTVTEAQIAVAQPVISLFTGVTEETAPTLKPRDLQLLRYAVAYQAVWMAGQVDVLTRMDVNDVTQDGMAFTVSDPDAMVLAPLAKRAVQRLSWMKTRSIHPLTPEQAAVRRGYYPPGTVVDTAEWLDDDQAWEPLGGPQ